MLNSLNVNSNDDGTTHVKYTLSFTQTGGIVYGEFNATEDEAGEAIKNGTAKDIWAGFKTLILNKLIEESNVVLEAK